MCSEKKTKQKKFEGDTSARNPARNALPPTARPVLYALEETLTNKGYVKRCCNARRAHAHHLRTPPAVQTIFLFKENKCNGTNFFFVQKNMKEKLAKRAQTLPKKTVYPIKPTNHPLREKNPPQKPVIELPLQQNRTPHPSTPTPHDVEVNDFTCGFICNFTCENSLLVAHVKT